MANFLIHQKILHVRPLIARQLDNLANVFVLLDGPIATKVLLEGFADSFYVQVIGESRYRRDTLSSVTLLHSDVHFFFRVSAVLVTSVLEGVCMKTKEEEVP